MDHHAAFHPQGLGPSELLVLRSDRNPNLTGDLIALGIVVHQYRKWHFGGRLANGARSSECNLFLRLSEQQRITRSCLNSENEAQSYSQNIGLQVAIRYFHAPVHPSLYALGGITNLMVAGETSGKKKIDKA